MTIGIFSDIHANLPALEAVLADIDRREVDMLYCLGDLVGYATWPDEVCDEIRRRHIPTIAGNYDFGVGRSSDDCGCAYKTDEDRARGAQSIAYTNDIVTDDTRSYLRSLPRHMRIELGEGDHAMKILMVHGSPRKINEYLFEDRPDKSFERMMIDADAEVMLFGHTHKPFHRIIPGSNGDDPRARHAINTGSVGKPKDGDPRAGYLLLHIDGNDLDVEFVRVEYDIERAAKAVEASPLPDEFAEMLRNGG